MKSCNYSHNLCVYTESRKADNNRCKYQFIHNRNSQPDIFTVPVTNSKSPETSADVTPPTGKMSRKSLLITLKKSTAPANGQYISDAVLKCNIEYFTHTSFGCCHSCRRGGVLVSAVKSKQNTDR